MFSEAVDAVIKRSGRKDRIADISSYVNQAIREVQSDGYFFKDLIEDQLTPLSTPYIWTRPSGFRKMRSLKYSQTGYEDVFPDFKAPGKQQADRALEANFYYSAGTYFVFSGIQLSQLINVAYYSYLPRLAYFSGGPGNPFSDPVIPSALVGTASPISGKPLVAAQMRPAAFFIETGQWVYFQASSNSYVADLGSAALNTAAQVLVSNWIFTDYFEMLQEGGLAKIFKNVGDPRAVSCFSLYKSLQGDFEGTELRETLEY